MKTTEQRIETADLGAECIETILHLLAVDPATGTKARAAYYEAKQGDIRRALLRYRDTLKAGGPEMPLDAQEAAHRQSVTELHGAWSALAVRLRMLAERSVTEWAGVAS